MKKRKLSFLKASNLTFVVLALLVVTSVLANIYISLSPALRNLNFPGTLNMLFDYSRYGVGIHGARFVGQLFSNLTAYIFMLLAVVLFIVSLCKIRFDKVLRVKCAFISLGLFVPATIGLMGGMVNFFGEGLWTLSSLGGNEASLLLGLVIFTLALDLFYLILLIVSLAKGFAIVRKVNRRELVPYEEDYIYFKESPSDKAQREAREATQRVELLENIREIVREELNRLDRVVIAKTATAVKEVVKPAPAPVEEEEEEGKKKSAPRIPFAVKMVKADKEIQEKYNEIKNEILAYGAKSRVSIACDTFRLHRKAYVKINLVGKTLKVYFALKPKAFEDSPIPVMDSSDKVAYEEVPALLKVKSNLAVKRAKELARLAFEEDQVSKHKEAEDHNWIKDLRADLRKK